MKLFGCLLATLLVFGCVQEIPIEELEEETFVDSPASETPMPPAAMDLTPPTIYSEGYEGTLTSASSSVMVKLKTTETAICRYGFQDQAYASLMNTFTSSNNGLDHSAVVSLVGDPKEVYIRCADLKDNQTLQSKIVDLTKPSPPPVDLQGFAHFSNFINSKCISCHQPGGRASSWDFSPYQSEEDWKNSSLVQAGNALNSKIYYRLKYSQGSMGPKSMPTDQDIDAGDVLKIKTWIDGLTVDMAAPPVVSFLDSMSLINEDGGSLLIKLKLNKPATSVASVDIQIKSGTATLGSDFTLSTSKVVFNIGESQKTFQVNIIDGDPTESSEGVVFTLANPVGLTLAGILDHSLSIIEIDKTKPVILGLADTVQLLQNQTSRQISFTTNEAASCSYSKASNSPFESMTLLTSTGNVSHSTTISELSQTLDTKIYLKCRDQAQNISDEKVLTFIYYKPFTPYGGVAHVLPGRVEAEAFDQGANGVAYVDNDGQNGVNFRPEDVDVQPTGDTMGGDYNVGWFNPGEWIQYTVNITQPGLYRLTARVASTAVNSFQMSISGQVIADFNNPATGDWQIYQNSQVQNVVLSAGIKTIRLTQISGNVNVNYFLFEKVDDLTAPKIANLNCSEPVKVGELFMCRIKLEGEGAKLEYDSDCDWLRIGGGGLDYVAVGTPKQFSNNCKLTLRASLFGQKSEDLVKDLVIDKSNDGVEVCDTPEIISYNTHIKPIIERNCLSCHDDTSEDGGISYEYIHKNNYTTFDATPETLVIWTKTIEQIRWGANGTPPKMPISLANGRRHFTKCEVKMVEKFMGLDDGGSEGLACNNVQSDPGEYVMHRLNNLEYKNTLLSLMQDGSFNFDVDLPEELPGAMGFTTMSLSRFPNLLHSNAWWEATEKFASHYIANKNVVVNCNDDNCARTILQNFARDAFRRNNVDTTYFNNLLTLGGPYQTGKSEAGVKAGIKDGIIAILMSPQFLMHYHERNIDGVENLSSHELANRISYALWQSPPDAVLRSRANNNSILQDDVLRSEVSRLLADPRSENFSNTFVFDWMGFRTLESKKEELVALGYPGVNVNSVLDNSVKETQMFFSHIVQNNRDVNELISANYTFANQELAQFYNLPAVQGNELVQVNSGNRKGILTHASVLAAHSKADATSPTGRGEFILDKFLCEKVGTPPAGVNVDVQDAVGISRTVSNVYDFVLMANTEKIGIDASKKIVGDTACIACHSATDPLGVTFESYDVMGRERTTYSDGVPVRTHSLYHGIRLNNSADTINYINQSGKFKACLTESLYHYTIRRDTAGLADSCAVQEIARGNDSSPAAILEEIFTSDSFKKARGER